MFPSLARALLLALAGLLMAGGVVGLMFGVPSVAPIVFGGLIVVGVVFERWRYTPLSAAAEARFQPTEERFLDPTTRIRVRVYADPATGERRYVREASS